VERLELVSGVASSGAAARQPQAPSAFSARGDVANICQRRLDGDVLVARFVLKGTGAHCGALPTLIGSSANMKGAGRPELYQLRDLIQGFVGLMCGQL